MIAKESFYPSLLKKLSEIRNDHKALIYGPYNQLHLTTEVFCFERGDVIIVSNNCDRMISFDIEKDGRYEDALSGRSFVSEYGRLSLSVEGHDAMILVPADGEKKDYEPLLRPKLQIEKESFDNKVPEIRIAEKPYEEMSVEELQSAILAKMKANSPLNDRMIKDVTENVYRDSLLNWVKSFR